MPTDPAPSSSETDSPRHPEGACIHQLFETQAHVRPDAVALTEAGEDLQYGALNARANRVAHYLREKGVGPGDRVGLCTDRSMDTVVGILGILKAGAAYVPLDPAYPRERIHYMVEQSDAPVVLAHEKWLGHFDALDTQVVCLDGDADAIAAMPDDAPDVAHDDAHLAYVIFTSGSTGKPKGVQVTHRNVVRLFAATDRHYGFDEHDVWALFHSFSFDVSVWEIWGALAHGGRLVIVPYKTSRSPRSVFDLLVEEGVTVFNQTPTAFRQFQSVDTTPQEDARLALRLIIFAGEELRFEMLRSWFDRFGDRRPRLVNMYGITETTVHATYYRVTEDDVDRSASLVGTAMDDLTIHLLDDDGQPVGDGEEGEIYVSGPGVTAGYINRPDLNDARFLDDPFSDDPDRRMYKSGDLARRRPDGTLEYHGRIDKQINLRGFRIELGEIEAVLRKHPSLEEVAAMVQDADTDDPRLVAYVVPSGDPQAFDASDVNQRSFAAEDLPHYMLPNFVVPIDGLPLTQNGKLDRDRLPWPPPDGVASVRAASAPTPAPDTDAASTGSGDATDDALADIVARVVAQHLDLDTVPRDADLFDLGASSMNLAWIARDVEDETEASIPVNVFLETPSVNGVVAHLRGNDAPDVKPATDTSSTSSTSSAATSRASTSHPASGDGVARTTKPRRSPAVEANDAVDVTNGTPSSNGTSSDEGTAASSTLPSDVRDRLAAFFADALDTDSVDPDADLFELGATSLTFVRLSREIRDEFGAEVPVEVFLETPTVSGIAQHLRDETDVGIGTDATSAETSNSESSNSETPDSEPTQTETTQPEPADSAASGEVERLTDVIHDIVCDRLDVDAVDVDRDLFELGATSLTLVNVSRTIQQREGVQVPVEVFLDDPTIRGVVDYVADAAGLSTDADAETQASADPEADAETERASPASRETPASTDTSASTESPPPPSRDASDEPSDETDAREVDDVNFFDDEARKAFKAKKLHLRDVGDGPTVDLGDADIPEAFYTRRASQRTFADRTVSFQTLSQFLGLLNETTVDGESKRLYPSAGGLYPVQTYVYVQPNAVEGMLEGVYYVDPESNRLARISDGTGVDRTNHFYYNRPYFDESAFTLFFVAQMDAIEPLYEDASESMVTLEAGYMGQLLQENASDLGLGVCPLGAVKWDAIRDDLGLDAGHLPVHLMVGGPLPDDAMPDADAHADVASTASDAPSHARSSPSDARASDATPASGPFAIVGMSARLPGADSPDAFWQNLRNGRRSVRPVPESRPELARLRDADDAVQGGFLGDVRRFDCLLFNLAPSEARQMDPQERLFLEAVWACLEDAGYTADALNASAGRVGVFAGAMWGDYEHVGAESWRRGGDVSGLSVRSSIANRVSHVFDFRGPSVTVDTACTSMPTALHLAMESIRRGECDAAIVGAANLVSHPFHADALDHLGSLDREGVSTAFAANADGWALGEGVGAVLIRPEDAATQAGDAVRSRIRGSWIGHWGRTQGRTVPNATAQAASIRTALERAGVAPDDVGYVETAAAGSSMADAAEVSALKTVFDGVDRLPIGSVKSNVGHLEAASGVSQLAKLVAQIQHGEIAPTIQTEPRNPLLQIDDSPLHVATDGGAWGADRRVALLNSFAAEGTCAHLVLQSPPESPTRVDDGREHVVPLSAATSEPLRRVAEALHHRLADDAPALQDVAATLQVGREAMRERLAVVASSTDELRQALAAFLDGDAASASAHVVQDTASPDAADASMDAAASDPRDVADAWTQGTDVDWAPLADRDARRVPLPTYPFGGTALWADVPDAQSTVSATPCETGSDAADVAMDVEETDVEPSPEVDPDESEMQQPEANAQSSDTNPSDESLRQATADHLRSAFASLAELPEDAIQTDRPLSDYGLNSAIIVALNGRLEDLGLERFPKTLFFEYSTLDALADHLVDHHADVLADALDDETTSDADARASDGAEPADAAESAHVATDDAPAVVTSGSSADRDRIAIVGLSGRYPDAPTVDAFWENLKVGRSSFREIPEARWDWEDYFDAEKRTPGKAYTKWGAFLDDVDAFDPRFFNISPNEADFLDPQDRLFLQTAWATLEDAGYTRDALGDATAGVYVGVMNDSYERVTADAARVEPDVFAQNTSYWSIANRVSYVLDLDGPSMAVDTACSSSLTAVHLAAESIRRGETDLAFAGGVNLLIHPSHYVRLAMLMMLSEGEACRPFAADADGMIPGEGVGCVLLKPLSDAVADGDVIHGVLRGSAVNAGGQTNGFTVPNPQAQADLVTDALARADVDPRTISYVEAHGTGTSLGDPIEVRGLSLAYRESANESLGDAPFCGLGSVKSNIGHLESAAGIASLTKVLLQLKHGTLAPTLHAEESNPDIDFASTPFRLQTERGPWARPDVDGVDAVPRRAGISSFGAGGANAHLIVEEYADVRTGESGEAASGPGFVIPLSARTGDALREQARDLHDALQRQPDLSLRDVAFTLQVGREAMAERAAFVTNSRDALLDALDVIAAGDASDAVHCASVGDDASGGGDGLLDDAGDVDALVNRWIENDRLDTVARAWAHGVDVDWMHLLPEDAHRVSLPTYPFERRSCWIGPVDGPVASPYDVPDASATPDARAESGAESTTESTTTTDAVLDDDAGADASLEDFCYAPVWTEQAGPTSNRDANGPVVIVGTPQTRMLAERLAERHDDVTLWIAGSDTQVPDGWVGQWDADSPEVAFRTLADESDSPSTLYVLTGLDAASGASVDVDERTRSLQMLALLQACDAAGWTRDGLDVTVVTRRTVRCNADATVQPSGASLRGLLDTAIEESPSLDGRTVDLASGAVDDATLDRLVAETASDGDVVAYRGGSRYVRHLAPVDLPSDDALPLRDRGVYLILGGAGGLGLELAVSLAERVNARVAVVGRSPLSPERQARLDRIEDAGGEVLYCAADGTDHDAMADVMAQVHDRFGAIDGVVHSALVLADGALHGMDADAFRAAFDPKVTASVVLSDVTQADDPDFLLFYSTCQTFAANRGQANYVAGCTFKDAWAQHLRDAVDASTDASDTRVRVVNWGYWADVGVASGTGVREAMDNAGLLPIRTGEGVDVALRALAGDVEQVVAVKARRPFLDRLGVCTDANNAPPAGSRSSESSPDSSDVPPAPDVSADALDASDDEATDAVTEDAVTEDAVTEDAVTEDAVADFVRGVIGEKLGIPAGDLGLDTPYREFGIDSILAVDVVNALNDALGVDLHAPDLFNYPTIRALSEHLADAEDATLPKASPTSSAASSAEPSAESSSEASPDETVSSPPVVSTPASRDVSDDARGAEREHDASDDAIAIVGMSGRFPDAPDVDAFWENLARGHDAVREVPADRWDADDYYSPDRHQSGRSYSKWAGLLDDVADFDAPFFNISAREAMQMDPHQRLFLEESWRAIEDAGYAADALSGSRCGVFVGCGTTDYDRHLEAVGLDQNAYGMMGNANSILAARIAYFLNLKGPSLAVDTACSSSLVAMHLACESLQSGTSDVALAGGVCALLTPHFHVLASQAGMLSPDGRCKAFADDADGFVPGEAVGVLVLKRLSDAQADGDVIHGVIRGTGTNQDGQTNGITAPSGPSQRALERAVYDDAGIDAGSIGYVETHGTGTRLGDPIEVDALTQAFHEDTDRTQFCALSAVKSNIGHALSAAGVAGVIKVLLAMRHGAIPPTLHCDTPNAHVDFETTPFFVNTELRDWTPVSGDVRRAAVSSFGFSGTNAHVVLDEPPARRPSPNRFPAYLVPLSAQTETALDRRIDALAAWLDDPTHAASRGEVSLHDLAYTLSCGRTPFEHRAAVVASDVDDLRERLRDLRDGCTSDRAVRGVAASAEPTGTPDLRRALDGADADAAASELATVARRFVEGAAPDVDALYDGTAPQRLSLPTYPFDHKRYWPERESEAPSNDTESQAAPRPAVPDDPTSAHPLIGATVSDDAGETRFRTTLRADQPYVADHRIDGDLLLPGAAFVEMARAAAHRATGTPVSTLADVVWRRPLVVDDAPVDADVRITNDGDADDGDANDGDALSFQVTPAGEVASVFAQGTVTVDVQRDANRDALDASSVDLDALRARCTDTVDVDALYDRFADAGFAYGPMYQVIDALHWQEGEVCARLSVSDAFRDEMQGQELYPALLDGALQSVAGLWVGGASEGTLKVPFYMGTLRLLRPLPETCWVHVQPSPDTEDDASSIERYDVVLVDADGTPCVAIERFSYRALPGAASDASSESAPDTRAESKPESEPETSEADEFRIARVDVAGPLLAYCKDLLRYPDKALDLETPLDEYGLDSVAMMEVLSFVDETFGVSISPTDMVQMSNLGDLVDRVHDAGVEVEDVADSASPDTSPGASSGTSSEPSRVASHRGDGREGAAPVTQSTSDTSAPSDAPTSHRGMPSGADEPIAIVSVAGRFPQSPTLEVFWDHLVHEREVITEIPPERWDYRDSYDPDPETPDATYSKWGGFLKHVDAFDASFFGIRDDDALMLDPQHRILMELAQELFDRGGYTRDEMRGRNVSVLVGGADSSYAPEAHPDTPDDAKKNTVVSGIQNMMAARISDYYDLHGSSMTLDTACSSSLVAIHEACRQLRTGACDMAVAGAITLVLDDAAHIGFSEAGVLSDDGHCYVFDERADGITLGEGAGLVLLKPLSDARADGDTILATVRGSAVNNDGRTMGITTPDLEMQRKAIRTALDDARLSADQISYLEAHGTGTLLGDPIEIKAATQAYRDDTDRTQYCKVGSVNSNVGHLLHASGMAGLTKILLAMQHGVLPATLNCETPHPRFNFPASPFAPATRTAPWDPGDEPRRAAISSFGFGGTNCHLIVEDFDADAEGYTPTRTPRPVTPFERKRYWPGRPIEPVDTPSWPDPGESVLVTASDGPPQDPADVTAVDDANSGANDDADDNLDAVLDQLSSGACSVDDALRHADA